MGRQTHTRTTIAAAISAVPRIARTAEPYEATTRQEQNTRTICANTCAGTANESVCSRGEQTSGQNTTDGQFGVGHVDGRAVLSSRVGRPTVTLLDGGYEWRFVPQAGGTVTVHRFRRLPLKPRPEGGQASLPTCTAAQRQTRTGGHSMCCDSDPPRGSTPSTESRRCRRPSAPGNGFPSIRMMSARASAITACIS